MYLPCTVLLALPWVLPQEEGGKGTSIGWRRTRWRGSGDGEDPGEKTADQEGLSHQL